MCPRKLLLFVVLGALGSATPVSTAAAAGPGKAPGPMQGYAPADAAAPPVTRASLLRSERFWPYRVQTVAPVTPPGGGKPLPAGTPGVLVRVESATQARIDFGRDGVHRVPIASTDLVERANAVREGREYKSLPNFVHAIGPRLMKSGDAELTPVLLSDIDAPAFLVVYADPEAPGFEALAAALAPLEGRHGVQTVLLPQGGHETPDVRERLRAVDWTVPFVRDYLVEGYTKSRLTQGTPLPALAIETREGRLLYESTWKAGVAERVRAVLDEAFGGAGTPKPEATKAEAGPPGPSLVP